MPATKFPLEYLRTVGSSALQLVVVGKDPFPSNRDESGIPFCKSNWVHQLASNCSGKYVIQSIGIDLEKAKVNYATPRLLFEALGSDGILFLNASYETPGKRIKKSIQKINMEAAHEINKEFLQKSPSVIFCGEAKNITNWIDSSIDGENVVHPDIRNRHNKSLSNQWSKWWEKDALRSKLKLDLRSTGLSAYDSK